MGTETEVDSEVVLRQVTSTAADFIHLDQISGNGFDAGIQGQTIALRSGKLESDPVVLVPALTAQDHRLAIQILDDNVDMAVVEKIAEGRATADLRDLDRGSDNFADIAKGAVVPVQEQELWLVVSGSDIKSVHLRVDMPVHHKKVGPTVIIKVEKCGAPANVRNGRRGDTGLERNIGEAHPSVVAKQRCILLRKVGDKKREAASMQIIAESDSHACLFRAILAHGSPSEKSNFREMALPIVAIEKVRRGIVGDK